MPNFNPQQTEAICFDPSKSHLLVIAGAGSGKTAVLVDRILKLQQDFGLNTWCMTFTRKAAGEMRTRYLERTFTQKRSTSCPEVSHEKITSTKTTLVEPIEPKIQTFHIIARDILTQFNCSIPEQLDEWVPKATQQIQDANQKNAPIHIQQLWQEIRPGALLIDEFQDINPEQLKFCQTISPMHLFAVGDDDQAIYGFRGSSVEVMMSLDQYFQPLYTIKLEMNYRSNEPVLALANSLFRQKKATLRKTLRCGRQPQTPFARIICDPRWVKSKTGMQECEYLASEILRLSKKFPELTWSDFAILVRLNHLVNYYQAALEYFQIPVAQDNHLGVQVLTVHASKGLQYPVVFIAGLEHTLFPHLEKFTLDSKTPHRHRLQEEERLFYVAITRAETRLHLLHCKSRIWRGRRQNFRPSLFYRVKIRGKFKREFMVFLHRLRCVFMVLAYMFWSMLRYLPSAFQGTRAQDEWINRNVMPWSLWVLKYMGFDLEVKQLQNFKVPEGRHLFVVSNHQSWGDIPALLHAFNRKLGFIAKVELTRVPILHYWMRKLGCIFVNRKKHRAAMRALQALEAQNEFTRIVLFPEGTRSKTGKLGAFKPGGLKIAWSLNAVIQPTIITGTRDAWELKKDLSQARGQVKILPQMDLAQMKEKGVTFDQFLESIHLLFRQELKEL